MARSIDTTGIAAAMDQAVDGEGRRDGVGGLAWALGVGDAVVSGSAGWLDPPSRARPVPIDGIFRISSVTKPIAAVAALQLVDEGLIGLDDPVDDVLPELAERRVMVDPDGPLDGPTVPAERALTLRDLLTFRCGFGMEFTTDETPPLLARLWELGIGPGPKGPDCSPDEFMAHLADLPLADQPGTRWRYHVGSDIAGVLVERMRGERLGAVLASRVFEPLRMVDTGFAVGADRRDRFSASRSVGDGGVMAVWDGADGQWATEPAFDSGAAGLVSTTSDLVAFGRMLLRGGDGPAGRVISENLVAEMLTDQLTREQRFAAHVDAVRTDNGWGLGGSVRQVDGVDGWPSAGAFAWDGGLGSHWVIDPATDVCAVLLTTDTFSSPAAPPVMAAFDAAIADSLR